MFRSLRWSIFLLGAVGVFAALLVAGLAHLLQGEMSRKATEVFVAKDVVADILPPPMYLIELRLILSQAVEGTIDSAEAGKQFDRVVSEYAQRVRYWTDNPPHGLEKNLLGRQHEAAQKFIAAARSQIIDPLQAGDATRARAQLGEVHRLYLEHRIGVDQTVSAGNEFARDSIAGLETTHAWAGRIALATTIAAVALVMVFYKLVLHSIQQPVEACSHLARQITEGDLTSGDEPVVKRQDCIGELQESLSAMRLNLVNIVGTVRSNADSVATASVQISQGNNDLSSRTERQASALEETAASMEELGATVRQNAEHANEANRLAQSASTVAIQGGDVVARVVETMKGIHASSQRIADIIGVIDGIAFQTNILALNAAVESARAGEQGRGFAVVAGEVRSLAGRSAEAAKQIKTLIGASTERVEQGATLVDQAGATMTDVVSSIQRVTEIVAEISSATAEQSAGVSQVGDAVMQMDQATQQNAALVEQSAAAAESLSRQAQQLVQVVSVFKLGRDGEAGDRELPVLVAAQR